MLSRLFASSLRGEPKTWYGVPGGKAEVFEGGHAQRSPRAVPRTARPASSAGHHHEPEHPPGIWSACKATPTETNNSALSSLFLRINMTAALLLILFCLLESTIFLNVRLGF